MPSVSQLGTRLLTPAMPMAPNEGLKPTMPQYEAGRTIEPAVCVLIASGTIRLATAAAEPPDEPPGVCAGECGLRVGGSSPRVANSWVVVLPSRINPACRARSTTSASAEGRWSRYSGE